MPLLIDTHTFIWFVKDAAEISPQAKSLIEAPAAEIVISIASIWEMSIKNSLGKLSLDGGFERVLPDIRNNFFKILPIEFKHTLTQNQLPFHHKDPFDRMIAAQAIVEGINLVSVDDIFDSYFAGTEVKRIW